MSSCKYCWIAVFLLPSLALAQETSLTPKQEEALYLRHQITIRGGEDPALVPLRVSLPFIVQRYVQGHGEPALGIADGAYLRQYSEMAFVRQVTPAYTAAYISRACTLAKTGDPQELARLVTELEQTDWAEREKLHREFLNGLSPHGRSAILDFVSKKMNVSFAITDYVGLAAEAPEFFRQMILEQCKSLLSSAPDEPVDGSQRPKESQSFSTEPGPASLGTTK